MKLQGIKPIENMTQVDRIEMNLHDYFRNENFLPGDSIPKEIELAEAMGVSRTAMREALTRFKTLGIIESKKNRGMVMTEPDVLQNMNVVMNPRLLNQDTMQDFFELRLVIEMGIVDILYVRKTDESIKKLEEIVEKEAGAKTINEILKLDIEFHSTLYKISGNHTIERFQRILMPVFDYMKNTLHIRSQEQTEDYVSHKVLIRILKTGTVEEFRQAMYKHLIQYFEQIK
ncbi:FadR/GntR family transcriptional regulator [Sphingobacterium sp. BN32]|uniref:FadR/GntR family transcriptional regulator n=1 Tax=Sphingobacterium sp. BN32 TaxID=3058432 RepID=UPI00265C8E2E|nr:FCD domain-containing protein [Sphingobacterium sp. BN32]WKK59429.1 FCD domain-containing protein [Sphingobacterium sp. BN32]